MGSITRMCRSQPASRSGVVWCLAAGLSVALAGCQLNPSIPAEPPAVEQSPPLLPVPPPEPQPARLTVVSGPDIAVRAPPDEAPSDLLARMRRGFSLPQSEDPAIERELNWYGAHLDYLDRVFARAERYLFHIAAEIQRRGMPADLALLPVVESAYDPFAYSHGRAAGLWQIIPGTGARLGLKQNWWYDGRRDILDSTRAALDYLEQLHELFDGDWLLAVAGYNSGEGNVSRAIRRARAAGEPIDFWHIKRYLPVETRTYVPRLLALQRLVANPTHYGFATPLIADEAYFDTIETGGQIDMVLAAELAGLGSDELYALNPGVNRWATDPDGPHRLLIPKDRAETFLIGLLGVGERGRVQWTRHRVAAGETLSGLALRYQTTPAVLREVNDLQGNLIREGAHLMIPHAVQASAAYTQSVDARTSRRQSRLREGQRRAHVVRAGESLWTISRRYAVGVKELASWNAMAPGDVLSVGRRLVVWTAQPAVLQEEVPRQNRIRRLTYVVRKGDSLSRISSRFRVTVRELLEWNDISSDEYLQPGQRLVMFVDVTEQST